MTDPTNELALAGCLLTGHSKIEGVLKDCDQEGITAESFEEPGYRLIYETACALFESGAPVDLSTVTTQLSANGHLELAGGIAGLELALDAAGTSAHAKYYAGKVKDAERERRAIQIGLELNKGECSPESAVRRLEELANTPDGTFNFSSHTFADLKAHAPDPTHHLVGNGWLKRGAGTLLTGGTGYGKSVLAAQIGLSVAAGINVLGCIRVSQPFKVLHIQSENDADVMKRVVLAIAEHIGADEAIIQENWATHHVFGVDGQGLAQYVKPIVQKNSPDLLIVDPYQSYLGAADINTSGSFLEWIMPIQEIIQSGNIALKLVCHTPKPSDRSNWNALDSAYLAAGTSTISNWARSSCELTTIQKETQRFRLRFGKNPASAGIVDDDGNQLHDLYIERSGDATKPFWRISEDQAEPNKSEFRDKVIDLATKHPSMSFKEIAEELGCSKTTVSNHYPKS